MSELQVVQMSAVLHGVRLERYGDDATVWVDGAVRAKFAWDELLLLPSLITLITDGFGEQ